MRNFLIFVVVLAASLKMGWDYLNSEAFQAYGDRNKAEWTCKVDFWMAESLVVLSEYDEAARFLQRAGARCPKTEIGEECEFEYAHSLETGGKRAASIEAYLKFIEDYPDTARAKLAQKSVGMLRTS